MIDVYIRASRLSRYADCPRRAISRIMQEVAEPVRGDNNPCTNIATAFGTAAHDIIARWTRDGKTDFTRDLGMDVLRKAADGKIVRYDRTTAGMDEAILQLKFCVNGIWDEMHKRGAIRPDAHIERHLRGSIKKTGTHNFYLQGSADLESGGWIFDYKTGMRMSDVPAQLGAYLMLAYPGSESYKRLAAAHIICPRSSHKAIVKEYKAEVAVKSAQAILSRIIGDVEGVYCHGILRTLANPYSSTCSAKYCDMFGTSVCPDSFANMKENCIIFNHDNKEQ